LYPFIEIFWIQIYAFGVTLSICFFLFLYFLKKLSSRFGYSFSFFSQNIIWFFLSVFLFSRIFYVIGRWNDLKYTFGDAFQFFIMNDYNFSLFWGIFGFFLVTYILTRFEKISVKKYIDGIVLSFLFVLPLGYLGSLLGWQVYGRDTNFGIEILYTHPFTQVPFEVPIFPLPVFYAVFSLLIFVGMYSLSLVTFPKGFIGYLGMILFSCMILIGEFFSGKFDILSVAFNFHLTQFFAIILIILCGLQLYNIYRFWSQDKELMGVK